MVYSRKNFGDELKERLSTSVPLAELARWAYLRYLDHANDLEPGLYDDLMSVAMMEEGPEFELTRGELEALAVQLCSSERSAEGG